MATIQAANSDLPLEVDQAIDPRLNLFQKRYYTVLKSAQNNLQMCLPASGVSDSSLSFTSPFTPSNILDKRMTTTWKFAYTAAHGGFTGPILNIGTYDCPRQCPNQQCITQISSQINTASFSLPTYDVISGILAVRTKPQFRDKMLSITPMWPDQYQEYSEGALTNRSPMGTYGDNPSETLRGGWPQIVVATNTTTAATWTAVYTDTIMLPPYETGMEEGPGFVGVTTNTWNISLGQLTRSWSHMDDNNSSGSPVWTSFTASIASSGTLPTLNYNILVPHLIPPMPANTYYPLTVIDRQVTTGSSIGPWLGGSNAFPTSQIISNMITLSYIPSMVVIYAKERQSDTSSSTTGYLRSDVFAGISNLSIQFNSQSGILANANQQQLYQFAVESGLEMSWPQFYRHRGSVLPLMFGTHIPLVNPDLAPGVRGSFTFQVNASIYTTNTSRAVYYNLYVLPYYEGTLITKPGVYFPQQGVISHENVIQASMTPPVNAIINHDITGGSFGGGPFSFIKNLVSKIAPVVEKVLPIAKALAPVVGPMLGMGQSGGGYGSGLSGGGVNYGRETVRDIIESKQYKLDSRHLKNKNKLVGRLV